MIPKTGSTFTFVLGTFKIDLPGSGGLKYKQLYLLEISVFDPYGMGQCCGSGMIFCGTSYEFFFVPDPDHTHVV